MKTTRTLLLLSLVAMLFSSCQKDSVTFRLRFKGFNHDAKVYIDNNRFPQWIPEVDTINVNGVEYPVSNSGQENTVTVATSANYLAVYPNSICQSISGNVATLLIPQHQVYRTAQVSNEVVQVVDAPMSAQVSSGSTLVFENGGALLAINVVNNYCQDPLMIDEITVSASAMALWGDASLNFSQSTPAYTITSQVEGHNAVTLSSINHVIEAEGHKVFYVYVPATPDDVDNRYTILVSAHSSDHEGTFTRSQTTANAGNIARGDRAALDFELGDDAVTKVWNRSEYPNGTIRGGKFSVGWDSRNNRPRQVFFSVGNLQYYCSSASPQWRFAPTQTHICGPDNNNPLANTGKWIDLFGWGTSGNLPNNYPYQTSFSASCYGNGTNDLSSRDEDWGYYITVQGNFSYNGLPSYRSNDYRWGTLTKSQWLYLLNPTNDSRKRSINGVGGLGHTFSIVCVNGIVGLLIYHDGFTQGGPTTLNPIPEVNLSNYPGCAFLPDAGYRGQSAGSSAESNTYYPSTSSTAWYWTADAVPIPQPTAVPNKAYALQINYQGSTTNIISNSSEQLRYIGLPVRLVCIVPPSSK